MGYQVLGCRFPELCLVNSIGYVACYVMLSQCWNEKHTQHRSYEFPHTITLFTSFWVFHAQSHSAYLTQHLVPVEAACNPFVDLSVSLLKCIMLTHWALFEHNHLNKVCIACVRVSHGRVHQYLVVLLELSKQCRICYQTWCEWGLS